MTSEATIRPSPAKLLIPALIGAAVALALGVYGHVHDPTGQSIFSLVFTKTINMKTWFATAALSLAFFQLYSGLRIYGRVAFPRTMPSWFGAAHRGSGTLAFLITVPVAYHCLWALGFQDYFDPGADPLDRRLLLHRRLAAKVVCVELRSLPGSALPMAGGLVFNGAGRDLAPARGGSSRHSAFRSSDAVRSARWRTAPASVRFRAQPDRRRPLDASLLKKIPLFAEVPDETSPRSRPFATTDEFAEGQGGRQGGRLLEPLLRDRGGDRQGRARRRAPRRPRSGRRLRRAGPAGEAGALRHRHGDLARCG